MYAIFEDSGTQIKVSSGDVIDIDRRDLGSGKDKKDKLTFDRVLLVGTGKSVKNPATIGSPYVSGATVTAEILDEVLGDKIDVIKFKRRKGYRVKQGHRQRALRVRITNIRSS